LRQKLNMTQQVFATEVGVGISTLGNWEKGRTTPSFMALEILRRFARKRGFELPENKQRS